MTLGFRNLHPIRFLNSLSNISYLLLTFPLNFIIPTFLSSALLTIHIDIIVTMRCFVLILFHMFKWMMSWGVDIFLSVFLMFYLLIFAHCISIIIFCFVNDKVWILDSRKIIPSKDKGMEVEETLSIFSSVMK